MKKPNNPKRILLAIDLEAQDPKLVERIGLALNSFTQGRQVEIQPVTVLNRNDAVMRDYFKGRISKISAAAEKHLGARLAKLNIKNLAAPKVLFADGPSTKRSVAVLLRYAKKLKCDLIALSSHGRTGMKRLFLGSFAETLALQSSIPLLIVNPKSQSGAGEIKSILFATDFSDESKKSLETLCRSPFGSNTKVILFHSYAFPTPAYHEVIFSFSISPAVFDADLKRVEGLGKRWCDDLRKKRIAHELIIDQTSPSVTKGILAAAKEKKVGMIAMAAGRSTRQVLSESPLPVWSIHP